MCIVSIPALHRIDIAMEGSARSLCGFLGTVVMVLHSCLSIIHTQNKHCRAACQACDVVNTWRIPCTARLWLSCDFGAGPLVVGLLHSQVSVSTQSRLARSSP